MAFNYGGRAEIVDAVSPGRGRHPGRQNRREGHPLATSTSPTCPTPTWSSAPRARPGSRTSCSGRSPTASWCSPRSLWPDLRRGHLYEAVRRVPAAGAPLRRRAVTCPPERKARSPVPAGDDTGGVWIVTGLVLVAFVFVGWSLMGSPGSPGSCRHCDRAGLVALIGVGNLLDGRNSHYARPGPPGRPNRPTTAPPTRPATPAGAGQPPPGRRRGRRGSPATPNEPRSATRAWSCAPTASARPIASSSS